MGDITNRYSKKQHENYVYLSDDENQISNNKKDLKIIDPFEFFKISILQPIFMMLSTIAYMYSLSINCPNPEDLDDCLEWTLQRKDLLFNLILFSAITNPFLIQIPKQKAFSITFVILFETFAKSKKNDRLIHQHGFFNFVIYIIAFWITMAILFVLLKLIKIRIKKLIIMIIITLILITGIFLKLQDVSCIGWRNGFKDSKDENKICKIEDPKLCGHFILNGVLDVNYLFNISCDKFEENGDYSFFYHDYKYIGLPDPQTFTQLEQSSDKFFFSVMRHLILSNEPLDTFIQIKRDQKDPKNSIVEINLKRNEDLVLQQNFIKKNLQITKKTNVILLFIDNISRQDFIIKLPKVFGWLEQFYKNQQSSHQSYQFFRYQTQGYNTNQNMMSIMYGAPYFRYPDSEQKMSYNYYYSQRGFITGITKNHCDFDHMMALGDKLNDLTNHPFDHNTLALPCIPEHEDSANPFSVFKGGFSSHRRCIYKRDAYDYSFEFGRQFWNAYPDADKLLDLNFMDAHESTTENVRTLDEPIFNFLNELYENGQLEDTIVTVYSDHGHHHSLLKLLGFQDANYENSLASLFLLLPNGRFDDEFLQKNEDYTIIGPDLYKMFTSFSGFNNEHFQYGLDIFGPIPEDRKCDENGSYEPSTCTC